MPITVEDLINKVGLDINMLQKAKWGTIINTKNEGVYIVSISDSSDVNTVIKDIPISNDVLKEWIDNVGGFVLDGVLTFNDDIIKNRFSKFWLEDENILYIGKASNLKRRIKDYYRTSVEKRAPHGGGRWIKILENLKDLNIYYIECFNSEKYESMMITLFGENVSKNSKMKLLGTGIILPFANLENGKHERKKHGISYKKL